jgi:hypothetical protein
MYNFGILSFLKFQYKIQSNFEFTDFQKMSPFKFKFKFQNLGRIGKCLY